MDDDERQRELKEIVNGDVTFVGAHAESDLHDESLHVRHHEPFAVTRSADAEIVWAFAMQVGDARRHSLRSR